MDIAHSCTFTSYFDLLTSVDPSPYFPKDIRDALLKKMLRQAERIFALRPSIATHKDAVFAIA